MTGAGARRTTERFADILRSDRTVAIPGVGSVLSARVVEQAGFEAIFITGYGVSAEHLGAPDVGLLTLPEVADLTARICDAVDLPVIVDIDQGYGGLFNVARAIRKFERAGAAGVMLDDQREERCPYLGLAREMLPLDEASQRIAAAVDARVENHFSVIMRCSLKMTQYEQRGESLAEFERRVGPYLAAGATTVTTGWEAPETLGAYAAPILAAGRAPFALSLPMRPSPDLATFGGHGYRIVIYALDLLYASAQAQLAAARSIPTVSHPLASGSALMPHEAFLELVGIADFRAVAERIETTGVSAHDS
ncbi:MAG: isocitrate lyase/PEP mutase family protein [Chloroflexota bacterium]